MSESCITGLLREALQDLRRHMFPLLYLLLHLLPLFDYVLALSLWLIKLSRPKNKLIGVSEAPRLRREAA